MRFYTTHSGNVWLRSSLGYFLIFFIKGRPPLAIFSRGDKKIAIAENLEGASTAIYKSLNYISFQMDDIETTCVIALLLRARRKRRKHRYWVHPLTNQRFFKGQFYTLFEDLHEHPENFFQYYHMSKSSFDELLQIIGPSITYSDTKWRKCINLTPHFFSHCPVTVVFELLIIKRRSFFNFFNKQF